MRAIDTNVVVRYLTCDDARQARKAAELIDAERVLIATTVLLETEWVLRRAYGFSSRILVDSFRALAGLPTVILEDRALVARAIDGLSHGMDFADALHLAAAEGCEAFATFDRTLARAAVRAGGIPVQVL